MRKVPSHEPTQPVARQDPERDGNGTETTQPGGRMNLCEEDVPRDMLKRPTLSEQAQTNTVIGLLSVG